MVADADNGVKDVTKTDSPVSVLADEDTCKEEVSVKLEDEVFLDAKNGDVSLLSESMAKEEENLMKARVKEEEVNEPKEAPNLNDLQFSKLDELLTQTQLYSEFLLEKMDNITVNGVEDEEESGKDKKRGRGTKRKASTSYNNKKAKRAVAAMLSRSKEGGCIEDSTITEEERVEKEQAELVPLLTGGKLKSYQLKGVKWLISLWQNGLNGILADQMGLGKTIQTIAFLAHLKGNGLDGPYLVIAPLSTLSNWVNEIERFVPSINTIIYHGDKKQRDELRRKHMPRSIGPEFPIVVTSYEIAMSDAKKYLRHYHWKYLVVDEGHRLKNSKCKLFRELKLLPIENKLLLTGTPLQNNLAELWSLLNFILPDIFSSLEEFESWFDLAGKCGNESQKEEMEEKRRAQVVTKLHAILRPFLLRRLKVDVEQMLPRKKEIILYATMTEHQKKFQDHLINRTLEGYLHENVSRGHGFKYLTNLMIQLRKNCNHPDLLESAFDGSFCYPPVEQIVGQCGKFRLLDRLLSELFARKHKVLIFSQWTKVLDIMDYYFSEKGFDVCRIDGSVKLDERKRQIKEFNDVNSDCRIFLLSTRAGGLGINLTAADTCILYDSDWNPQMDLQAMDRCHRIGQTKPVHVYRLAPTSTGPLKGRMMIGNGSPVGNCYLDPQGFHSGFLSATKGANVNGHADSYSTCSYLTSYNAKKRLLNAPPETLGAAALALHYANVIIVIEKLVASPHLIGHDAREDLYNMLPASLRGALRSKLKPFAKSLTSSVYDTVLAGEWNEAMLGILEWLAPLAHNMIRWQSERSFEHQNFVSRTNVLLVQTLYYANQEKTESAITELLVGLNYIWRYGREVNAKAIEECASARMMFNDDYLDE